MVHTESSELINFDYFNAAGVVVERLSFLREHVKQQSLKQFLQRKTEKHLRPKGENEKQLESSYSGRRKCRTTKRLHFKAQFTQNENSLFTYSHVIPNLYAVIFPCNIFYFPYNGS